ncbi:hypothetical protein C482_04511 [Natrialba chahannaoensis JCM 10990]|uniref:Uncharacterized protein n=1 Tax=Natrialba chahannaoensis JCM 10990 TaxID=1227492 RepID=M0AWJ2_9EURY|nr:hypothetical protein [Natrialba chahannaoensis]ELZ02895.1 hypothetical protein C482_04511 [Natrialba chahannaoensis JCM 10990]
MSESNEPRDSPTAGVDTRLYFLIGIGTIFGIGHHLDHIIRGNHVGWPLIPEVTVFTYTLLIYPVIAIGVYLTVTEQVGVRYWTIVLGGILFAVVITHFGPWATEPPQDVIDPYESVALGYAAFGWLLGLVISLAAATTYSIHRWIVVRRHSS